MLGAMYVRISIVALVAVLSTSVVNAQCSATRERRPWRLLSCREQTTFMEALQSLKDAGVYDDFVMTHQWMNSDAHGVAEFLPWHRWFIHEFESALREYGNDPCITLPYWDWEQDAGDEFNAAVFQPQFFGSLTGRDQTGACIWSTARGNCLRRSLDDRFAFWSLRRVLGMVVNFEQYTDNWDSTSNRMNGFRAALEGGPHANPHNFVGGTMISMAAPDDPLFYLHHANVDRIWAIWQDWMDHDQLHRDAYEVPIHYEGRWIDEPMSFPPTEVVDWDFRSDETGDYPTPRDVLNMNDRIRVRYVDDQMARTLQYTPNSTWFESASTSEIWVNQCDEEDRRLTKERKLRFRRNYSPPSYDDVSLLQGASLRGRSDGMLEYVKNENQEQQQYEKIGPPRSSFSDDGQSFTTIISDLESCLNMNTFSRQDDRDAWGRLCEELPLTATYAERLAAMAEDECDKKGNPFGATPQWIERMKMTNEIVAFECFHLPDRLET
ncbi:tyrosinase central domain containing protein [Nitzschia inconspicua]|uniref:Tyrosinase central domain containing protein n=1 Tax=Nitzschia inconspicua TaxID=303405 RepID=A0A9K3Q9J1_9STRA|nr:tyrosinase central domain containing protein [Nitzschia inconspicua]